MDQKNLTQPILESIDKKLDQILERQGNLEKRQGNLEKGQSALIEKHDTLELKIEAVNAKMDRQHKELLNKIDDSQEDTITVLTDVINEGYSMHEERIKKLEKHIGRPHA